MLEFILKLSFWQGLFLTTLSIALLGIMVILVVKRYVAPHLKKQHEKVGRLLFRVTAGLIALLVSLSYANERVAQGKIINALEEEASLLVNTAFLLNFFDDPQSDLIREKFIEYIDLTIKDDWKTVNSNPFFSDATNRLKQAYGLTTSLPTSNADETNLKNKLLDNLVRIIQLMQVRIYSRTVLIPNLIYILCIGLLFMWIFYTVYPIDLITLSFISLYNLFIGTLIYFVLALSNPLAGPLKINAHSFEVIQSLGIEKVVN
jgi:hypothetical protein